MPALTFRAASCRSVRTESANGAKTGCCSRAKPTNATRSANRPAWERPCTFSGRDAGERLPQTDPRSTWHAARAASSPAPCSSALRQALAVRPAVEDLQRAKFPPYAPRCSPGTNAPPLRCLLLRGGIEALADPPSSSVKRDDRLFGLAFGFASVSRTAGFSNGAHALPTSAIFAASSCSAVGSGNQASFRVSGGRLRAFASASIASLSMDRRSAPDSSPKASRRQQPLTIPDAALA